MCDVRPFCGLRYNLQRVNDPSTIIAPPYDLISSEERPAYYRLSPYNIVRLESGEEQAEAEARGEAQVQQVLRRFGMGAQVLLHVGLKRIRLITRSRRPIVGLEGFNLEIVEYVSP